MNNLSFLLTLSYNVRLAFSLFLISPQQHRILLLGHCCMYSILFYVFVYLICYRKKKKKKESTVKYFVISDFCPTFHITFKILYQPHQDYLSTQVLLKFVSKERRKYSLS